jgi:two-component system, LuxR family, sensor kinase FixL
VAERLKKIAQTWSQRRLHPSMPISRLLSRSYFEIGFAYLAGYVLLDWVSFVHPVASLGITPWNPPPGLSFALILLFGPSFLPWLFIAPFVADALVRDFPLPIWAEVMTSSVIGLGYGIGALALARPSLRFDVTLASKRDILLLIAAAALAAALVALSYVSIASAAGLLDPGQFLTAVSRYWIGDMIGIAVVTPVLLVLFTRRRAPLLSWDFLIPLAGLAAALWLIVGVETFRFQLFYLLFLPVIWTAVRFGLEGVTLGLAVTQIGLIAAIQLSGQSEIDVTAFQALMIVLALTGLAVGILVDEQQHAQHQLRLHQEALSRVSRVGSMGEFAAALAHEINQPLTAIATYTRLAKEAASAPDADLRMVTEATAKAAEQVDRAAEVVRRLREFIRLGRSDRTSVSLEVIVEQVDRLLRGEMQQHGIVLETRLPRDLPLLMADSLQIQQVVLNILRNAIESITSAGRYDGRITIEAAAAPPGSVTLSVRDNGPGFDAAIADHGILPFATTKPNGMGLGLSLSRSIVEAHGGALVVGGDATGAVVTLTLGTAEKRAGTS